MKNCSDTGERVCGDECKYYYEFPYGYMCSTCSRLSHWTEVAAKTPSTNFHKLYGSGKPVGDVGFESEPFRPFTGKVTFASAYTGPGKTTDSNPPARSDSLFQEATFKSVRAIELTLMEIEKEGRLNTWINIVKAMFLLVITAKLIGV